MIDLRGRSIARRRMPGQPLALLLAVLVLWVWLRVTLLAFDDPAIARLRAVPLRVAMPPLVAVEAPWVDTAGGARVAAVNPAALARAPIRWRLAAAAPRDSARSGGVARATVPQRLSIISLDGRWSGASQTDRVALFPAADGRRLPNAAPDAASYPSDALGTITTPRSSPNRWSVSAWLLARPNGRSSPGTLVSRYGASQAGALAAYRLGGTDSPRVYVRATRALATLDRGDAELAAGVSFDIADLPVAIYVERRVAIEPGGRDAFALFASGGFASGDERRIAVEGYGQAGIVGLSRRTPFADASVVARHRVVDAGGVTVAVGAGSWAGVQPGAARVDIGPRIEAAATRDFGAARVSLDWRQRVAGSAQPGSGPALTLTAAF